MNELFRFLNEWMNARLPALNHLLKRYVIECWNEQ